MTSNKTLSNKESKIGGKCYGESGGVGFVQDPAAKTKNLPGRSWQVLRVRRRF